jgi:hypothetical protein
VPDGRRPAKSAHPLAQAVYASVYTSREQRVYRMLALLLLIVKHTVRGLFFSWPLYLMAVAGFYTESPLNWLLWLLGVPGIAISLGILARGVREDYRHEVVDRLLTRRSLTRLLKGRWGG